MSFLVTLWKSFPSPLSFCSSSSCSNSESSFGRRHPFAFTFLKVLVWVWRLKYTFKQTDPGVRQHYIIYIHSTSYRAVFMKYRQPCHVPIPLSRRPSRLIHFDDASQTDGHNLVPRLSLSCLPLSLGERPWLRLVMWPPVTKPFSTNKSIFVDLHWSKRKVITGRYIKPHTGKYTF